MDETEAVHRGPLVRPAAQRGIERGIHGLAIGLCCQRGKVDPDRTAEVEQAQPARDFGHRRQGQFARRAVAVDIDQRHSGRHAEQQRAAGERDLARRRSVPYLFPRASRQPADRIAHRENIVRLLRRAVVRVLDHPRLRPLEPSAFGDRRARDDQRHRRAFVAMGGNAVDHELGTIGHPREAAAAAGGLGYQHCLCPAADWQIARPAQPGGEDVIAFDQQGTAFADAMLDQPVRQGRTRRI